MARSARIHFAVSQQLVPAIINALLNGGIAWAMHRHTQALALWGGSGYASDLLATGLLLPGITWLILHPLLRHQAAAGRAPALAGIPTPWLAGRLPGSLWKGSLAIGAAGTAIGLIVSLVMHALGAPAMAGGEYSVFKGLYGGLLTVLLQPSMVFAILRSPARAAA